MTASVRLTAAYACACNLAAALAMGALARGLPIEPDAASRLAFIQEHQWAWRAGWAMWVPTAVSLVFFYRAVARALPDRFRIIGRVAWIGAAAGAVADIGTLLILIVQVPASDAQALPDVERTYELAAGLGVNLVYTLCGLTLNVCCLLSHGVLPRRIALAGLIVWPVGAALSGAALVHNPIALAAASAATIITFSVWCGWIALHRP